MGAQADLFSFSRRRAAQKSGDPQVPRRMQPWEKVEWDPPDHDRIRGCTSPLRHPEVGGFKVLPSMDVL